MKNRGLDKAISAAGVVLFVGLIRTEAPFGVLATLTEWKNGTYTPKADKLILIARYFNVPLEFFYPDLVGNEKK